jgi:uncharacterized protein HemX
MNDQPPPKPETTPEPGSARAVRGARITGRVFVVLAVSITLAVGAMIVAWYVW